MSCTQGTIEQVPDGVLIFVGIEAAQAGAPPLGDDRLLVFCQYTREGLGELSGAIGLGHSSRRHLACRDAVVNLDPGGKVVGVRWLVFEIDKIQVAYSLGGVMAKGAVLLDESVGARKGRCGCCPGSGEKGKGQYGDQRDQFCQASYVD